MKGFATTTLIAVGLLLLGGTAGRASAQVSGCSEIQQTYTGCERPSWSVGPELGSLSGLPNLNVGVKPEGVVESRFEPGSGLYRPPADPVVQPSVPPTTGVRDILNRQRAAQAMTPVAPMAPLAPLWKGTGEAGRP